MKGCTPRLPPTLQVAKVCAESVPITFPTSWMFGPRWWVRSTLRMFQSDFEALPLPEKDASPHFMVTKVSIHKVGHRISLFMFMIVGERGLVENIILQKQWMQTERYWLKF